MRRFSMLIALFVALGIVACNSDNYDPPVSTNPTPAGDPRPTDKLLLIFIPPCANQGTASTASKTGAPQILDLLDRLTMRELIQASSMRTQDGWRVMELTAEGVMVEETLHKMAVPNLPTCLRLPANNFGLVVTAEGGRLEHAMVLTRELRTDESWSGAKLWLQEHTTHYAQVTSVAFVQGSTDRFSFAGVATNGTVDISFMFQPGGIKEADQIPVKILRKDTETPGNDGRCDMQLIGRDYHVKCPLP